MKRRSLLAVLCALVLVVVAVVLIGDSDRHGTEATTGKPFTGSSGVTRSVASIVARQRFVDRHPSVLPSAAEIAAAEGVQPGEGEAAREGASGGAQPDQGDEQAQPEGDAQAGEPPQRSGPSAIGPKSSLSSGNSFLGADISDSGFVPPDSMGAVSDTQVLVD